jgi:tetratricopeptide (TPR) repeat protein
MRDRYMAARGKTSNRKIMRGDRCNHCSVASVLLLLTMLAGAGSGPQARAEMQTGPQVRPVAPEASDSDVKQMLSIAETQHEIVKVLIAQGRFDRVLPEMKKIFDLKLPDKYEGAVAQSAGLIANLLAEKQQFALSYEILEEAQRRVRQKENKASLLKIQAYVYKIEGNLEKALQALERAVELEKQRND